MRQRSLVDHFIIVGLKKNSMAFSALLGILHNSAVSKKGLPEDIIRKDESTWSLRRHGAVLSDEIGERLRGSFINIRTLGPFLGWDVVAKYGNSTRKFIKSVYKFEFYLCWKPRL